MSLPRHFVRILAYVTGAVATVAAVAVIVRMRTVPESPWIPPKSDVAQIMPLPQPTPSVSKFAGQFSDCAAEAGLDFTHYSPLSTERHLHLFMGSGLAWIDYDVDGAPDLFICQGAGWQETSDLADLKTSCRLYRNNGNGTFTDVTIPSGLQQHGYSMGATVGDYDNDGLPDLFVSRFGPSQLYRNCGDGSFAAVAPETATSRYASSCTFADIDQDGDLDLYVAHYLDLSARYPTCQREIDGQTIYFGCHPRFIPAEPDLLYRNNGEGSFTDISRDAGLRAEPARQGLGVMAADFDEDGDIDFYVANDSVPNQMWINDGTGRFHDEALKLGVALNRGGLAAAGMGVGTADVDGNERLDLVVTNFYNEGSTLFRNDGATFTDVTAEFGLSLPSRLKVGFGVSFIDADNDGWEDLYVANGHVHVDNPFEPFEQTAQLFWNRNGQRFHDVSPAAGQHFQRAIVARGTAVGDFNRDGRADIAVLQLNGPVSLLRNDSAGAGNSLRLELIGMASNRSAIGALVRVETADDSRIRLRTRTGGCSYLSCDDHQMLIGLGESPLAKRVTVRWPSGRHEYWEYLSADVLHRLIESTGQLLP